MEADSQELLSLIDSMDLNEEFIDKHLNKIMIRNTFTIKHMENALRFLKYKLAINKQEGLNCSNEREYEFIGKLIPDRNAVNIALVCDITHIVLQLDPPTIISKCEHLLQQVLGEIELPPCQRMYNESEILDDEVPKALLDQKLVCRILESLIVLRKQVSLPFLQVPLEKMVFCLNERILNFFFTNTIRYFKMAVTGFSLLDRIWACLKSANHCQSTTLTAISYLVDYYLPLPGETENQNNLHNIATESEFWETVLFGLQCKENSVRKKAVFVVKRALDSLTGSKKDININTPEMVMVWDQKNEKMLKSMWDNFFILIDSLEEMQSNIVLPSLKLFEAVKHLGHCWLSCAYNIGLQHNNASVRLNCIRYRLEMRIESKAEALTLLSALNDIPLYENETDTKLLTSYISKALEEKQSLINILQAIPSVKWSPVPLYYLSGILGEVVYPSLLLNVEHGRICTCINDILRLQCNSPIIKKAIYAHISNFIVNSCKGFTWDDYALIYPNLHLETPINSYIMTALAAHIKKNMYLSDIDKNGFTEAMTTSCENINIALLYVGAHEQDGIPYFLSIINDKVDKILDISTRPYANKIACLADVIFLINMYSNTVGRSEPYMVFINGAVMKHYNVILHYLSSLLTHTLPLDTDSVICLYNTLNAMPISDITAKESLLQLYKSSVLLLSDKSSPMDKKTSAIAIINYLAHNQLMKQHYQNEMQTLEQFLAMVKEITNCMSMQGSGKLKNTFYEKSCEIVLSHLREQLNAKAIIEVFGFVEDIIECGGLGCLKFNLRIIINILPKLIDNESVSFNFSLFLNQMWKHIAEIKTNREYVSSVDDFVKLITQDQLLRHPEHNNIVVSHYSNIIDMAITKRMPLYFLVKHLSDRNIMAYDNMVNVLSDILLYVIVPKKEQRITENLIIDLLPKMQGIVTPDMHVFSQHIHFLSLTMLSKVTSVSDLNEISYRIMSEVDQLLKAKPRYYPNNTTHRKLLRALQLLLFIFLKTRQVDVKKVAIWCMNLLRISHDVSVKTCLLWYIALYIYSSDITIDSDLIGELADNGVPLICQFYIVYYVMRHKIPARMHFASETEFVLDFLLFNTMGSVFSIRLSAQYLALMLFETGTIRKKIDMDKYRNIVAILKGTLGDLVASNDNSFNNLRNDYYIQSFDIVGDLTPMFIFHTMRRRCDMTVDNIETSFAMEIFNQIEDGLATGDHDAFFVEWKGIHRWHTFVHYQGSPSSDQMEIQDEPCIVQKKYVPWRNVSAMEEESERKSKKKTTELIVVASLVSRSPNLGGLARTCEVFGVMTYIVDNLRHVQDKEFQSLSVSADRWVDMDEVHVGRALRDYLVKKKKEGYSLVAAEQTSNSRDLIEFRFPRKSLLILGNEKDGIPPNLLPLMDYCVEIPQHGVIRSLNVHVSASIFIWEYVRQFAAQPAVTF